MKAFSSSRTRVLEPGIGASFQTKPHAVKTTAVRGRSLSLDGSPRTSQGSPAERPRHADIILLASLWQTRALLRAQLIEEGFEVLATDTWPMMRQYLRPGSKPRLAIVDLQGLPDPERALNDLRILMKPNRVLVLYLRRDIPRHQQHPSDGALTGRTCL